MNRLRHYIRVARPKEYVKNGFIFLPLFFGHRLNDYSSLYQAVLAFCSFCLAASSVYVFNDIHDMAADRAHPVKKDRPLAGGQLKKSEAYTFLFLLLILSLFTGLLCREGSFLFIWGSYVLLNVLYTLALKHLAVIDVACIAIGFVLRVYAGGMATGIWVSQWLVIMTFLLALFLALAKRRDDLLLVDRNIRSRLSLDGYNLEFISLSMVFMAAVTIVSYILYTVSPEVIEKHGTDKLYLTTFWVIMGLLRYMQIVFVHQKSGSPTLVLLKDVFLQLVVVLWMASFYLLVYVFKP